MAEEPPPPFLYARMLASGGIANSISSALLNSSDVIKVRLQTQDLRFPRPLGGVRTEPLMYNGFLRTGQRIVAEEGLSGLLLPGLGAAILRDLLYSSIRMGLYPEVKRLISPDTDGDPGLMRKIASGALTGAIGSAIANPTDVVKIRLQAEAGVVGPDGKYVTGLAKGASPTYTSTLRAFGQILRTEGVVHGLYAGVGPTMVRAALLTAGQLASYDHSKYLLKEHGILNEGPLLHIIGSLIAGLVATTVCAPADMIKTRVMSDRAGPAGQRLFSGPIDCAVKLVRVEGLGALFRGWSASYARLAPHFIIALPLYEQIRRLFGLRYM
eukprot:a5300_13.p1 GENE.a5300_13~~a5300_13.p1  ORF type:complete len:340 (+),score=79.99 a5300_13:45-1022(+)